MTRTSGTAAFSIDYQTANGTATAGDDYIASSGALQFAAGETTKAISITINGDTTAEPNETFFVNLSDATNGATIGDAQGVGTIFNDDHPVFEPAVLGLSAFSYGAGGWFSQNQYPRALADVNGDGQADIVGFASDGAYVALAGGGGHFASPFLAVPIFGAAPAGGGWFSQNQYPRALADVNGDSQADIVGFGSDGAYVALATGGGHFAAPLLALPIFGGAPAGGWTGQDQYPRALADVNGDGLADIVGFGSDGAYVALATGGGHFAAPFLALPIFGAAPVGGGWTGQDQYPRALADVNGDGLADIVGFGAGGAYVALATGGGHFAAPTLVLPVFGADPAGGGWVNQDQYPRELADVNGDGRADIVGFGALGTWVAHGTGGGTFDPASFSFENFGASALAGGWTSDDTYPRLVADVTGDHKADAVGFGSSGVYVALSHDPFVPPVM